MKHFLFLFALSIILTACNVNKSIPKSNLDNETKQNDISIKEILQFAGIEVFNFNFEDIPIDKNLLVYVKEYENSEFIKSDTIFSAETTFYEFTSDTTWQKQPIETIGLFTQREYETSENLYFQVRISGVIGAKRKIIINPKYRELHSWRTIKTDKIEIGKEIFLLLFGASWDDVLNGVEVKRFCTAGELNTDLSDSEVTKIPHYYLVCIKIQ